MDRYAGAPSRSMRCTLAQRNCSASSWNAGDEAWQLFANQGATLLDGCVIQNEDDFRSLHQHMTQLFHHCFPKRPASTPKQTMPTDMIENKWHHLKAARMINQVSVQTVFRAWTHIARFHALNKQHRMWNQHRHRAKIDLMIHDASLAAAKHDAFSLFQIINRRCPRVRPRRIQLRHQGQLLAPTEEHDLMVAYIRDTWSHDSPMLPTTRILNQLPFSEHELAEAFSQTPLRKAVASSYAPGVCWRTFSHHLAKLVYAFLTKHWLHQVPSIPQAWVDGWITWLPKPSKPAVSVAALRPLALQEPLGKQILKLVVTKAQQQAGDSLVEWPQFAYQGRRGTFDALCRVSNHCHQVHQLAMSQRLTPHDKYAGATRYEFCGGIMAFLDLQRAFDTLDRAKLFPRLAEVGVQSNEIAILHQWHVNTYYHVEWDQRATAVPTFVGLRQGCPAAPFLWSVMVVLLCRDLVGQIPYAVLIAILTCYADDFHLGAVFYDYDHFCAILRYYCLIIDHLQTLGLTLSPDRTKIHLLARGSKTSKLLSRHCRQTNSGQLFTLDLQSGPIHVPMGKRTKYLGAIMGYQGHEHATLEHRLQSSDHAFHRLKSWLCKRSLPVAVRLHLWRSTVYPVMTYSLWAVGITRTGLMKLQSKMTTMLRKVIGDASHATHTTNFALFERRSVAAPLDSLHRAACAFLDLTQARLPFLAEHDILHQQKWPQVHAAIHLIDTLRCEVGPLANPTPVEEPDFGPSLLLAIQQDNWAAVVAMDEAIQFLRTRCILCGFSGPTTQSMNRRYRQYHAAYLPHTFVKSA